MEKWEDFEKREDHDDHESEEEQHSIIHFMVKQLEVLLEMNRPNFTKMVKAFKRGSSKSVGFELTKHGNFDRVQDRKVIDVWFAEMDDYLHATKVGQQCAMELA
jgi:hypothetical protein